MKNDSDFLHPSRRPPAAAQHVFFMAEGFAPTVIDSQVLDTLCALQTFGLYSDLIAFVTPGALRANWHDYLSRRSRYQTKLNTRVLLLPTWRPYRLAAASASALLSWTTLYPNPKTRLVIHARGHNAAHIAVQIKRQRNNVMVLYDIRGDAAAEYRMMAEKFGDVGALKQLPYVDRVIARCITHADSFLAVSHPLRDRMAHLYGLPPERTTVVPCLADEQRFFYSPQLRQAIRSHFNLHDKHVVIFAGSTGRWHHLEYTLLWLHRLMALDPQVYFVGITPDVAQLTVQCEQYLPRERYLVRPATHDEVPGWLNAADLGVLLRIADPVNAVASPTKFAEYMLCGLPTLTSANLGDVTDYVRNHHAGVIDDGQINDTTLAKCLTWLHHSNDHDRLGRAQRAWSTYSKAAGLPQLAQIYRDLESG